jgi:hypothetical protein
MNDTGKSAVTSVGVMGPALAIIALLLNKFLFKTEVLTDADLSGTIDAVATLVGLVTGIIGRWKATKPITTMLPVKSA